MNQEQKMRFSRGALGLLFVGAGVIQVTHREFFAQLVPTALSKYPARPPWPPKHSYS
jgi:uncharacterized membrane protein